MSIVITLPFPGPELSPNSRCGWRAKAKAVQAYRYECKIEGLQAKDEVRRKNDGWAPVALLPAAVTITFILKDKRRHDWDNLLASFKAGIDGLVDAGLLPDDDVRSWTPTLKFEQGDKACIKVELT